jgi:hypothetical protein
MSGDPNLPGPGDIVPAAPTEPPPRRRHPLGLPPGSVRALLILMIMGTIWLLLLMPEEKNIEVPLYLYYLQFLTLGSYFSARSNAPVGQHPPPLYLPRGSIRTLIILGFLGVIGHLIYLDPGGFSHRQLLSATDKDATLLMPVVMIGAYIVGAILAAASYKLFNGPLGMPAWYSDVQAWVSLIAVLGLGIEVVLQLIVFPTVENPPKLPQMQLILSAIVSFYFGARA